MSGHVKLSLIILALSQEKMTSTLNIGIVGTIGKQDFLWTSVSITA